MLWVTDGKLVEDIGVPLVNEGVVCYNFCLQWVIRVGKDCNWWRSEVRQLERHDSL